MLEYKKAAFQREVYIQHIFSDMDIAHTCIAYVVPVPAWYGCFQTLLWYWYQNFFTFSGFCNRNASKAVKGFSKTRLVSEICIFLLCIYSRTNFTFLYFLGWAIRFSLPGRNAFHKFHVLCFASTGDRCFAPVWAMAWHTTFILYRKRKLWNISMAIPCHFPVFLSEMEWDWISFIENTPDRTSFCVALSVYIYYTKLLLEKQTFSVFFQSVKIFFTNERKFYETNKKTIIYCNVICVGSSIFCRWM